MKILLDMGHTLHGADTGAEGCGRREQDCTRDIGYKIKSKLESLGNIVVVCSKDSSSSLIDSLSYRVNTANSFGGDLYLSLHLNAFNGNAYGTEIYTNKAKKLYKAEEILKNMAKLGYHNRGIKDGSNLYVIKNTTMEAILVECCFIDNQEDMNRYNPELISNAIINGLVGNVETIKNDWIRKLQDECNRQGFSNQIVDGISGGSTLNGCPILRYGAQGNITKLLQERLTLLGFNTNGIDGIFGVNTRDAIMQYQRHYGLSDDGVVGENTWRNLLGL